MEVPPSYPRHKRPCSVVRWGEVPRGRLSGLILQQAQTLRPMSTEVEDTCGQSAIYKKAKPEDSAEAECGVDSRVTIPDGLRNESDKS